MSTTIDQRVVEMRFDNKHFEQNVSTTMSTLDKLKQKLRFDGATKGLENVNSAAKKVDMAGLGTAVDTVQAKFSIMDVVGVTALANITNAAVNAGKRIASALTIDPVKTGFQEYETQINAVQTILANTESKGTTIDDVNRALEELNKYADMTIYNFTEMTRNIGTFTAAGVDLDTSTNAIKGIANLAAVSGSTSQQASTAMYQLSQALSSGTVKLMDWNSVVNAGMGGQVFQDALKETARVHGVAIDDMIEKQGSFRETLSDGWLTSEILTETLQKFTLTTEGLTEAEIEANREMLRSKGYTEEQIEAIFKLGNTATDAATKVKTFTQLWDVLKEAAQSGWSQSWKIMIGDFEEAKALLTPLANVLTGIINKTSDARNAILEKVFGGGRDSKWDSLAEKIDNAGISTDKLLGIGKLLTETSDTVQGALEKTGSYTVKEGDWLIKIAEAYGTTWEEIYELNKDIISNPNLIYPDQVFKLPDIFKDTAEGVSELTDEQLKNKGYTQEQIELYKELAKAAEESGMTIEELLEAISKPPSGRDLLIDAFKNLGSTIAGVANGVKGAWEDIFGLPDSDKIAASIYNAIAAFNRFTESMRLTDKETGELNENGEKIKRTFKGIFAAVDIVLTVLGGPLKIALKAITQLLGMFDLNILDVTAVLGDSLVTLRDWIDGALDFTKIFEPIVYAVTTLTEAFHSWISSLKDSENLPRDIAKGIASGFGMAIQVIKDFIKKIARFFTSIPDMISGAFSLEGALPSWMYYFEVAGKTIVELGKIILEKINGFLSANGFQQISEDSIAGLVVGFREGAAKAWAAAVAMVSDIVQRVKDFLGIHSPSTVFAAIGGFMVAGLIAGLQNGIPDSLGAVKDLFQPMLDWISGLDFGAVMAAVFGVMTASTANKAVNALSTLASPFEGLADVFEGTGEILQKSAKPIKKILNNTSKVVKSFSKVLNSVAFSIKVDAIKTLVETLLFLVGAIIVLTFFDPKELWNAVGIITVMALVLAGLAFAVNKMGAASAEVDFKKGIDIKGLSTGLTGIGMAILMMAAAVRLIGKMSPEETTRGLVGLAVMIVATGAVFAAFGLLVKGKTAQNIDKFGKTMSKFGVALLLMAVVVKILGGMDRGELIQGGVAIIAFSAIIVGLVAATKLLGDNRSIGKIGGTLVKMAIAIGLMALVAKALGGMDRGELIQGGVAIVAFGGIIVGLMAATRLITKGKNVAEMGGTLLKISLAIGIMALVVKMLANMEPSEIIKGTLAVAVFGGMIVGLMAATKLISGSKNIEKIGGALLAVSGAIAIMALTAIMLSMISWEGFAKGTIMITAFAGIMVGLMAATKLLTGSKNVEKIGATLISVAAAIGILALVAVLLGMVPVENLIKGTVVVGVLSILMGGLIAVTKFAKNCIGNLIVITTAIAILAGAVYLLSTIEDSSKLYGAAAAMAIVLGMFGLVITSTKYAKKALSTLIVLTVAIAAIGGILYLLAGLPVESVLGSALALGGMLLVMAGVLKILSTLGPLGLTALASVGILTALVVPIALLGLILAMMSALGVSDALPNAIGLSVLLIAMSAACAIMSMIPVVAAVNGALGLSAFIGIMAGLLLILGGLSKIPGFNDLIADGGQTLALIGKALGGFVGSIVSGFAGEVLNILPMLGNALSAFMVGVQPFIAGAKNVDLSVLEGVGILSAAILALTVADLIAGVSSFLQGGSSFADLGTQLSQFMLNALPFIMMASMVTPDMISGVKALAETILIITAADILQGLTSFITGGSSLESFASQLPLLGKGIVGFADSLGEFSEEQLTTVNAAAKAVKTLAQASSEIPNAGGLLGMLVGENDLGTFASQFPILGTGLRGFLDNVGVFTEEQVTTVDCAAKAIKTLAQASSEIPNTGGLLGQIVGENDLSTFASQFPILGTGLRGFLDNVGTFSEDEVATVDSAAQAIKLLAEASSEIPNSGGWLAQIVGENDLGTFAEQFPSLGEGLKGFLDNVGELDDTAINAITAGANAVSVLAKAATSIPNEGGWISKIVGDNSLGTFADNFPTLGKGIAGFVEELGTFSNDQVTTVNAGVKAVNALAGLANANLASINTYIGSLGTKLPTFATNLATFCTNMPDSETMSSAVTGLNTLIAAVKSIGNADTSALAELAENLKKIGKNAVKKFVEAFTSTTAKSDCKDAAEELGEKVVEGIEAKESAIKKAGKSAAKEAVDGVKTQKDEMKSAGKDLGSGLVKGIKAKWDAAYDAGYTLGQKAVQGEKDGQASNSPSKLTIQAGKWLGEGLIVGIGRMGSSVYDAGHTLGEKATKSISASISAISDAINTDIDAQPTIRPVLDLSDVRAGASSISSMFGNGASIGVNANVNAISSMMNGRSQNGANEDVVSAIDKLRKDLSNVGNTSYTISGVTYDDGSNIADAVRTITRAAVRERRV